MLEQARASVRQTRDALKRYREADPEGSNPIDSLGEAYFINGRFAEAEKCFLEAQAKLGPMSAAEWLKAAQARYMQGDVAKADAASAVVARKRRRVMARLCQLRRADASCAAIRGRHGYRSGGLRVSSESCTLPVCARVKRP